MRLAYGWLALMVLGCGGKTDEAPGGATCAAGETLQADGKCAPAKIEPKGCVPGELELADKSCQAAGVPVGGCGKGFKHDGKGGCDPILPAAVCAKGQLAVPGDAACHEIGACGAGPYPELGSETKVQRVDASYKGGGSDGSVAKPWTTIQQAIDAAEPSAVVAVAAGSYPESVSLSKPVRIWGRCAAQVAIIGGKTAAVTIAAGASNSELKGLALSGSGRGVSSDGAKDLLLDATWIHDTAAEGLNARASSVTVRASLSEGATGYAIALQGADLVLEASAIRDTVPGKFITAGIDAGRNSTAKTNSHVTVRGSLLEKIPASAIRASSSEVVVETTVIRDILPVKDNDGEGLYAQAYDNPEKVTVRQSVIERSGSHGLLLGKVEASVENTVIRGGKIVDPISLGAGIEAGSELVTKGKLKLAVATSLVADYQGNGILTWGGAGTIASVAIRDIHVDPNGLAFGLSIRNDLEDQGPGSFAVTSSVVERSEATGIVVANASATIDMTAVRDLAGAGPSFGAGILATGFGKQAATIKLTRSLVDGAREVGVWALGGDVTIEDSSVKSVRPDSDGGGAGIAANDAPIGKMTTPAKLTLRRAIIDGSIGYGIGIFGKSSAIIEDSAIRNTAANGMVGGDGISVISQDASATMTGAKVANSARAAVASFGAKVSIGTSALSCQSFDLDGEPFKGAMHTFADLGDNTCGCPDPKGSCKATSEKLTPPDPLPPPLLP